MKELVRPFGVELEYFLEGVATPLNQGEAALQAVGLDARRETYNHRRRNWWKVVQDASVQDSYGNEGGEAVSPVLRGEEGLADVTKAADALRDAGFETNKSCGTHVHFGIPGFGQGAALSTDTQKGKEIQVIGTFLKNWMVLERALDAYQVPHRRKHGTTYAKSIAYPPGSEYFSPEFIEEKWEQIDVGLEGVPTVSSLQNLWEGVFGWNNNYKVNVLPMWSSDRPHRTLEVRHLHGTLNAGKIVNWIRLINDIWIAAVAGKVPDVLYVPREKLLEWTFDYLETDQEVREYVTGQCKILGALDSNTNTCRTCRRAVRSCRCGRDACRVCGDIVTRCSCCQDCLHSEGDCVCCPNCGRNHDDGDCECLRCQDCGEIVTDGYEVEECTEEINEHGGTICTECCDVDHSEEDEDE